MPIGKSLLSALIVLGSSLVFSQEVPRVMPLIVSVQPPTIQIGGEVTATGDNLDQSFVTELGLTDGTNDFKVSIVSQTSKAIKFKIPDVKPGRYGLVTYSEKARKPSEIEQPVKLTVKVK